MRITYTFTSLLLGTALAVPPPFVVQGDAALNLADAELPPRLADLSSDDILNIEQVKAKAEHIIHDLLDKVEFAADALAHSLDDEVTSAVVDAIPASRWPHPGPPLVLNFSDYTILEIVNASLGHHCGHGEEANAEDLPKWKLPWKSHPAPHHGDDHEHDPKYLPLHRLAWLVNRSEEAQKSLSKGELTSSAYLRRTAQLKLTLRSAARAFADHITLLAPDDNALRPPHRRGLPRHRKHSARSASEDRDAEEPTEYADEMEIEMMEMAALEQEMQPIPHPFHMIAKEGRSASKEKGGDDEEERKRKLFAKIIAYVLECECCPSRAPSMKPPLTLSRSLADHTLPEIRSGRSLADSSTVGTLLDSSRVKVEPAFAAFPHPYPTVRFNGYSYKKGPTIIAKNGIIHLVGAPLLPPLSPVNGLYLFPQVFSTLTSGLQKIDLAKDLVPHLAEQDEDPAFEMESVMQSVIDELLGEHKDVRTFTVFAPGNFAFNRLG